MTHSPTRPTVADLLEALSMDAKTGALHLFQRHEHGIIYLYLGRVIDAAVAREDGGERLSVAEGDAALVQMLDWDNLSARFQPDARPRAQRVQLPTAWFLLRDRRRAGQPPTPMLQAEARLRLAVAPPFDGGDLALSGVQWRVLSRVRGEVALGEVAAAAGLPLESAAGVAAGLIALGFLESDAPSAATAAAGPEAVRPSRGSGPDAE